MHNRMFRSSCSMSVSLGRDTLRDKTDLHIAPLFSSKRSLIELQFISICCASVSHSEANFVQTVPGLLLLSITVALLQMNKTSIFGPSRKTYLSFCRCSEA